MVGAESFIDSVIRTKLSATGMHHHERRTWIAEVPHPFGMDPFNKHTAASVIVFVVYIRC